MNLVWQGEHEGQTVRVVDLGAGAAPRVAIEYLGPVASMGEPTWLPFQRFDIGLIVAVCLALGIIR